MTEAQRLIAEIQDRLEKLYALLGEQTTEPKRLQPGDQAPAIEWLKQLDEPLRSEALKAVEERPHLPGMIVDRISNAINWAFYFSNEERKWQTIYEDLKYKGQ